MIRATVRELDVAERERQATVVCSLILEHPAVKAAGVVALFAALPDEIDTSAMIDTLCTRCCVVLPRICGDEIEFFPYSPQMMQCGAMGISEPMGDNPVDAGDIDVMILPGMAFTSAGARLGRGKGYYDRYLSRASFKAYRIGICYSQQLQDKLPVEPHDIVLDEVVCM